MNNFIIFQNNHEETCNATPIPYPTATATPPRKRVSRPDLNLFRPIRVALANPKLKSYTAPIPRDNNRNCCYLSPLNPALITYGIKGKNPKIINDIRVTTPFHNGEESSTTNPNY